MINFELVNPRQTVLVTCREETDILGKRMQKDDIVAVDWHTPLSSEPFMYAVALAKSLSYELIHKSRAFVVNFVPYTLKEEVLFCGTHSGRHIDKFAEAGLTKEESQALDCPRIKEAIGFLECEVVDELETGDHVLLIARVMNSELKRQSRRPYHIKEEAFTTTEE